jgi:hypothetical protein
VDKPKTKICARCKKEYPATNEYFRRNSSRFDRLDYYCKTCAKAIGRAYMKDLYARDREVKGKLGVRCPLWTKRCGECFYINSCWRIKNDKPEDLPVKLAGLRYNRE